MTPTVPIRPARAADVPALAVLIASTWPHEAADPAQLRRALAWDDGSVLVVGERGVIRAFIGAFLTQAAGERRWELDLMAVAPAARGQGLATALVAASLAVAAVRRATLTRALIAADNQASQRTVARFGLAVSGPALTPWIAEPDTPSAEEAPTGLLPVETLSYAGLWVEPPLSGARLRAARGAPLAAGRTIGALLPCDAEPLMAAAARAGYHAAAERRPYHWWTRAL